MLQLFCLGAPQLTLSTAALQPALTPKALALFVYLTVTQQTQSRDTVADLLWSETSNQQARSNLRNLLPEVRQRLGDYLVITPHTIAFQRGAPYWLDVEQLRTTLTARLETIEPATLQAALQLYQGEFLAGFNVRNAPVFEAWVVQQREELHTLAVQGGYRLAEHYWQQAAYQSGLATTQRLLQWEPWHEAGHRLQMQLLAASGQRTAALTQYERCRTILADELGVEPEAATSALYEQIRSGAYDKVTSDRVTSDRVTGRHPVTLSPSHPLTLSPPHNLPGSLTPFFGRETEIAQISTLLLDDRYRLVTLVGEGGSGKTRLALAVAQTILDLRFLILDSAESSSSPDENPKSKIQNQKFPDGIWFVTLNAQLMTANLADQLAVAVAQAIHLALGSNQPLFTQLLAYRSIAVACGTRDN